MEPYPQVSYMNDSCHDGATTRIFLTGGEQIRSLYRLSEDGQNCYLVYHNLMSVIYNQQLENVRD